MASRIAARELSKRSQQHERAVHVGGGGGYADETAHSGQGRGSTDATTTTNSSSQNPPTDKHTAQLQHTRPTKAIAATSTAAASAATSPPSPSTQQQHPSSSTSGFFQPAPYLENLYASDPALPRALSLFLTPSLLAANTAPLTRLATEVLSPRIQAYMLSAEHTPPHIQQFDTFGRRVDRLVTSEGWRGLQDWGIGQGMVALPYENTLREFTRVVWAARYVLWAGSACWVNCPGLMVDGVAGLLRRCLTPGNGGGAEDVGERERVVLRSAYEKLVSREVVGDKRAWTTGQWMTERQGGSDVSMTETVATWDPEGAEACSKNGVRASDGMELGPWRLDGFKWFSSATDCDMVVLLARTAKGVGLFYAPMRRTAVRGGSNASAGETELNGVRIQRLKNKLGTRALPTAELELEGMRGWLIGEEGRGTKEIATVLNIARMHNGLTAIGLWGRGLAVVRAFVKVRVVGKRPLWERTGYMKTLSRMHAEYKANVLFNFFVAGLLGCAEQTQIAAFNGYVDGTGSDKVGQLPGVKDTAMAEWLLRVLTPALKGHCSKTAISGLQECMECMGGVGYLENDDAQFNIARLYRDANVLPIWEGTTDMMADDTVVRVLFGKTRVPVMEALSTWVESLLAQSVVFEKEANTVRGWWADLTSMLEKATKEQLELQARSVMDRLVDVVQGLLLLIDAVRDGDEVARLVMEGWFERKEHAGDTFESTSRWKNQAAKDLKIVFGRDGPQAERARL